MQSVRRFRDTLLTAMILIALVAVLLGGYMAATRMRERQRQIALLKVDFQRRNDRVDWSEKMHGRGYLSKGALLSDQQRLEAIRSQLSKLGALPKAPRAGAIKGRCRISASLACALGLYFRHGPAA